MPSQQDFSTLKANFFSLDSQIATAAAEKLGVIGGDEALDFLLPILESENAWLRNNAALALRDIGDSRAVEPLFRAIQDPRNVNRIGTLVYALEKLDCSQRLPELFDILFYGRYEAKMSAATILDEQVFEFSAEDLHSIQRKWNAILQHPEQCPDFTDSKGDIQSIVDGFVSYLS